MSGDYSSEGIYLCAQVIESLAKCGADINELNMFRKALSEIKGGRLAQAAYPSKVQLF